MQSTCSSLEPPLFWKASRGSCCVAPVEPPVFSLESAVTVAGSKMAILFKPTSCAHFACCILPLRLYFLSCAIPLASPPSSQARKLLQTSQELALKQIATREILKKNSLRERNKHIHKVKRDQNSALDRYVLLTTITRILNQLILYRISASTIER